MKIDANRMKLALGGLLIFLVALMTYQMLELPLWGYRPLLLNLGVWGFLNLIAFRWIYRGALATRHFLLSALSGLLFYLGFPDQPFTFCMFLAFVPLLMIERERSESGQKGLFIYAFNTFFFWNITSVFWLMNTSFSASIFTFILNALLMTWTFLIYSKLRSILGGRYQFPILFAVWTCFELFHLSWDISFPWLNLGNALSQYPIFIQWYEYTGAFGGSLWILLVNFLVFQLFIQKEKEPKKLVTLGLVLILPMVISLVLLTKDYDTHETVKFGVIQPNFEPHYEKFEIDESIQADRFIELSEDIVDQVNVLIYPETSFGLVDIDNLNRYQAMRKIEAFLESNPNVGLLTGIDAAKFTTEDDQSPHVRPYQFSDGSLGYWKRANVAMYFQASTSKSQIYRKSKLVPGAEKLPYRNLFPFLESWINALGGSVYGLEGQRTRSNLNHPFGPIAPIICYESVYGDYVSEYVRKGAKTLAIITNDGWWDDTPGHRQHLAFATMRAIEQRKYILRSANTGISAVIDPHGKIIQSLDYNEEGSLVAEVSQNSHWTFYTKWGDLIARMALFLFVFMVLAAFAKILKARREA